MKSFRVFAVTVLSALVVSCGSDSADNSVDDDGRSDTGNTRVRTEITTRTSGVQTVLEFEYDENGLLSRLVGDSDGASFSFDYTYDNNNLLQVRNYAHEDGTNISREYMYDGAQAVGYFKTEGSDELTEIAQYRISDGRLVGIDYKTPTPNTFADSASLEDGELFRSATYVYDGGGGVVQYSIRDADGSDGRDTVYQLDESGRRTTAEGTDLDSNVVYSIEYQYELGLCVKNFFSTITRWVCVD